MAIFGIQLVFSLTLISFFQKMNRYYSLGQILLCKESYTIDQMFANLKLFWGFTFPSGRGIYFLPADTQFKSYLKTKNKNMDQVRQGFESAGHKIADAGSDIYKGTQGGAQQAIHQTGDQINAAKNAAGEKAHNIANSAKGAINQVGEGAKNLASSAEHGASDAYNQVQSGAQTAASKAAEGVGSIVGVAQAGLKNVASKVEGGVKYVADGVGSAAKSVSDAMSHP